MLCLRSELPGRVVVDRLVAEGQGKELEVILLGARRGPEGQRSDSPSPQAESPDVDGVRIPARALYSTGSRHCRHRSSNSPERRCLP